MPCDRAIDLQFPGQPIWAQRVYEIPASVPSTELNPTLRSVDTHGPSLAGSNGPLSTMLRRFSFASLVSGCAPRGSSFQHPTESYDLSVRRAVAHRRERTPWSTLKWLGQGASGESPGSIKSEVAKLAFLRQLGAHEWDLSDWNPESPKVLGPSGSSFHESDPPADARSPALSHPRGLASRDHA